MLLKLHSLSKTSRLCSAGANVAIPMQELEFKGQYLLVITQREEEKRLLGKKQCPITWLQHVRVYFVIKS